MMRGSNRSIITAKPSGASESSCTTNCRFSPTVISDVSGASRSSIMLVVGWVELEVVSIFSLFGVKSSTGVVTLASDLAGAAVVETLVVGATTLLSAAATSKLDVVELFAAPDLGCGIAASVVDESDRKSVV